MPLEATHIRFSLDIKDDLEIGNLEKYIAGTIYPDSRYLSGIERSLTHNLDYFKGRKNLTDFEKGWFSHVICDRVFKELAEDKFSNLVLFDSYEYRWPAVTAIKVIQDIRDFASCDIQAVIDFLDYYEIYFREDERRVIEYNGIIKNMYKGKAKTTAEDCLLMWEKLGTIPNEMGLLRKRVVEFHEDEKLIGSINENFEDGMDLYDAKYRDSLCS
jgi:hypothetical protein